VRAKVTTKEEKWKTFFGSRTMRLLRFATPQRRIRRSNASRTLPKLYLFFTAVSSMNSRANQRTRGTSEKSVDVASRLRTPSQSEGKLIYVTRSRTMPPTECCPGKPKGKVSRVFFTSACPVRFQSGMRPRQLMPASVSQAIFPLAMRLIGNVTNIEHRVLKRERRFALLYERT